MDRDTLFPPTFMDQNLGLSPDKRQSLVTSLEDLQEVDPTPAALRGALIAWGVTPAEVEAAFAQVYGVAPEAWTARIVSIRSGIPVGDVQEAVQVTLPAYDPFAELGKSLGYVYATQPGQIGADQYFANIRAFMLGHANDLPAVVQAMQEYGVSIRDVLQALTPEIEAFRQGGPKPAVLNLTDQLYSAFTRPATVTPAVTQGPAQVVQFEPETSAIATEVDQPQDAVSDTSGTDFDTQPVVIREAVDTVPRVDGVTVPLRLDEASMAAKVDWYKSQRAAGFTDAEIRTAVEQVFGPQLQSDWSVLVNAAVTVTQTAQTTAKPTVKPAGAGAGTGTGGPGAGVILAVAAAALALLS